jgi:hypothetical protein
MKLTSIGLSMWLYILSPCLSVARMSMRRSQCRLVTYKRAIREVRLSPVSGVYIQVLRMTIPTSKRNLVNVKVLVPILAITFDSSWHSISGGLDLLFGLSVSWRRAKSTTPSQTVISYVSVTFFPVICCGADRPRPSPEHVHHFFRSSACSL